MSQVNKYANKAGYTADKNRKDTQSAVSYIEDDGALIYDGVNVVVDKPAAGVGDLAVFDKTTGTIRFVKGATLVAEQLSPQLVPVAVVYARQGERVLIVSLRNAASSVCWAYSYEVALSYRPRIHLCPGCDARGYRRADQCGREDQKHLWLDSLCR